MRQDPTGIHRNEPREIAGVAGNICDGFLGIGFFQGDAKRAGFLYNFTGQGYPGGVSGPHEICFQFSGIDFFAHEFHFFHSRESYLNGTLTH